MISMIDLTKAYHGEMGDNVILSNVSLHVAEGRHLGILAEPASGKSTISRMILGVEPPTSGAIVVNGAVSWPVGFAGGFHPELSGEENVRMIANLYGVDVNDVNAFCLEFSELEHDYFQPVKGYSSVMRAILGMSLSFAFDFDVFLADEVVGAGDNDFRLKCEIMLDARIDQRTFIFLSRNRRLLEQFCDEAAVLVGGRILQCRDFEEASQFIDNSSGVRSQ